LISADGSGKAGSPGSKKTKNMEGRLSVLESSYIYNRKEIIIENLATSKFPLDVQFLKLSITIGENRVSANAPRPNVIPAPGLHIRRETKNLYTSFEEILSLRMGRVTFADSYPSLLYEIGSVKSPY